MKTTKNSRLTRVLVTALVVCMLACFMLPTTAMAANQAVNDAKAGVLQVNLIYTDDANNNHYLGWGTGFLVNDNTVVTCHHVINLEPDEMQAVMAEYGKTEAEIKSRLSVTVTVSRDVTIPASVLTESFEMDFAVLRLSSSLQGKTPLKIRDPQNAVQQAEEVYAIGFPDTSAVLQSYNTYTSSDATITQGIVNKIGVGTNLYSGANTDYIQTSCNLDYGNSGGPMVDENGYVIGICQGFVGDTATEYYNAVSIEQVTEVLNALGILYEGGYANAQPVETEPEPVVTEPEPVVTEPEPVVTEPEPEPVLPEPPVPEPEPDNNMLLLIIAAVAVVVIVLIVVVVVVGGKKKPAPAPAPAPVPRPVTPPVAPAPFVPAPTYPTQDAGETTVLGGSAGETTVLSRNAVNGGSLTRKRTGEVITISADQFVIGRERKSVNYCISDNNSISRNHVRLSVRGGVTYLTDLNAANGTFVNGVKVQPRQEIALKNGDKITLADEDLEYKN